MTKKIPHLFCLLLLANLSLKAQSVIVDGSLGGSEGYVLKCLQDNYTQFGDATTSTNVLESPNGSELDGAYAKIANNTLYLFFAGNLENSPISNRLEIFLDCKSGGQNVLTNTNNYPSEFENVNKMAGLKFDAGFESDYWFTLGSFKSGTQYKAFMYVAETNGDPVNGFIDNPLPDVIINNTGGPYNWTFQGGQFGLNNSNNAGVGGAAGQVGGAYDPSSVSTGIELAIPLAYIGNPTGDIKVCAFINSSAHDYVSNQILCGLGGSADNLQNPIPGTATYLNGVDFTTFAGDQFFVVSQTSDISSPFAVGSLGLHPSPTASNSFLHLFAAQNIEKESFVSVLDIQGACVWKGNYSTHTGENIFEIPSANFPSGVYFVQLQNGNYMQTQKLLVERR